MYAQKVKKSKVRLKVQYVKIIDGETYIDIVATSKIKRKNIRVSDIEVAVYYRSLDNEKSIIGKTITNTDGEARFILEDMASISHDTLGKYNMLVSFKGNESFKKSSKKISFKDANIKVDLITKDSINYIRAKLTGANNNSIDGEAIQVQVQRLFNPLIIGDEFHETDENGTIEVAIDDDIPGIDRNLTIEVVLNDSDEYGTVKAVINAPIGVHVVKETTFDERTMWSSRDKTPIFLLIFPNILIVGIWSIIAFLIFNLYKIFKS